MSAPLSCIERCIPIHFWLFCADLAEFHGFATPMVFIVSHRIGSNASLSSFLT